MKNKLRKFNHMQRALVQGINKWFVKGDIVQYLNNLGEAYAIVRDFEDGGQYIVPVTSLDTLTEQEIKEAGIKPEQLADN